MSTKGKISVCAVLILAVSICVVGGSKLERDTENKEKVSQEATVEPLVIKNTPKNTNGTLTIYDPNGGIYYQYSGAIDVVSSGWNGNDVEIKINLPSLPCSCFDEDGNLRE